MAIDTDARGMAGKALGLAPSLSPLITWYGDSRAFTARGYASRTANVLASWVEALSSGRVRCPGVLGLGNSGYTSAQLASTSLLSSSIATARSNGSNVVVLICSTNDRNGGTISAATSIANLRAIETAWVSAGFTVIWLAEYPRGDSYWTGTDSPPSNPALGFTRLTDHYAVRRWILSRRRRGVFVIDTFALLADRTSYANSYAGYAKRGYLADGIHLNTNGCYRVARYGIIPVLEQLYPEGNLLRATAASEIYSATTGHGALNANSTLGGTGGTVNTGSGVVATSWSSGSGAVPSGLTATYSKATVYDGWDVQQVVYSGTAPASASTHRAVQRDLTYTGYVQQGARVIAVCDYEIDAGCTGVVQISPFMQETSGGQIFQACEASYTASEPVTYGNWPSEAYRAAFVIEPMTLASSSGNLRLALEVKFAGGSPTVGLTIRILSFAAFPFASEVGV